MPGGVGVVWHVGCSEPIRVGVHWDEGAPAVGKCEGELE